MKESIRKSIKENIIKDIIDVEGFQVDIPVHGNIL